MNMGPFLAELIGTGAVGLKVFQGSHAALSADGGAKIGGERTGAWYPRWFWPSFAAPVPKAEARTIVTRSFRFPSLTSTFSPETV